MKLDFRYLCLAGLIFQLSNGGVYAQDIDFLPDPLEDEEEIYVPPPPSEEDLRHYEMMREADRKWSALFADPTNAELHLDVARHYNTLGIGDIALHELSRAEALGIPREELLADIGRAYHNRGRYDDILNEITFDLVPAEKHGEVYLLHGHAYDQMGRLEDAFIHYYQADQLLEEDLLELSAPLAKLYSDMGDYEKAEQEINKAIEFSPKDANLLALKGELVHRRAGAEKSYQYYERAHFYAPDNMDIKSSYAGVLYNLGRYDEMVVILRAMLAVDSRNAFANYLIAVNFARGGNIRTASRYLNQAGNQYDQFAPALFLKGKLGYATNNYAMAEEELKKLLRLDADHGEGRRVLGAALMQQGKHAEAARTLDYLVEHNLADENDYALLGSAYILARDYDKGDQYLSLVDPSNSSLNSEIEKQQINDFAIGRTAGVSIDLENLLLKSGGIDQRLVVETYKDISKGQYAKALEKAATVIDQDRGSPLGYNLLGLAYAGQNKVDEARSNYRRALGIDRNFHSARINLAKLELKTGNRNESIGYLNQILSNDQGYIPAYNLMYEISLANGDVIAAERYLTTAATANSDLIAPRAKLFDYYIEQNNIPRARTTANRLITSFSDHALSHKAMGLVSFIDGDLEVARDHLEHAMSIDPAELDVYLQLANVYKELGRIDLVRPLLEQGLVYVNDKLPLQIRLVELAREDSNFQNSLLYANQLKLTEATKADAFIYEGDLYLLQSRGEEASRAFTSAIKAGANAELLRDKLLEAEDMTISQEPVVEEVEPEPPVEPSN